MLTQLLFSRSHCHRETPRLPWRNMTTKREAIPALQQAVRGKQHQPPLAKTTIRLRPLLQEQVNLGQRTARISSLRKWKARWGRKNNPRRRREQIQQPCSQGRPMEMGMRSQYKRAWRLWLEVRDCCPNKARPLFQKITTPNPGAARPKRTASPCSTTRI
ncbi:hypothetical protein Tc00.1047053508521.40 [Trypanosoma cruzi]|uniref:Uncharacterized protein n=1 Tax=Trypanosoma cruzi (strain CL Brener) TaxID=353153 RepID=Q4DE12_TRYCC|nr:hypothetical protein Tc00.1047053508521.40 [Trypanosoma cruzi]EAN90763.1 hypothetical protein Tc00.1047053508521.40 [Trypanosoma cruzi]|eukprot:XP_812614.1 hypothetical protein [Trypanosoma cruzi strain CL Brener]